MVHGGGMSTMLKRKKKEKKVDGVGTRSGDVKGRNRLMFQGNF